MKHSVLFQPTKMVHEMFTISVKTSLKFERHKLSFFDILNFSSIMYYFNSINVYVDYMSTVKVFGVYTQEPRNSTFSGEADQKSEYMFFSL